MELRVLQYFLVVAREENITKAASLLHITQPTLSRQLMQMEKELGVKLFRRGKHNILLTEDGMLLRRRAQEIVDLAEKTEKELRHGEEAVSGEISIGCGETRNMKLLSEMIASFQQKYPDVSFNIYTAIADDVKERLESVSLCGMNWKIGLAMTERDFVLFRPVIFLITISLLWWKAA